ncbi:hypothetical protein C2857_000361 [Epichloe festucae Fl1]|uniref:Protein kinase domain-containing protein n=1 Tax=Epichloe festucae (strain Fl1) TaxID=877507 RepID=A0A7S9PX23_EPIFF|nr:hypothetical protein C2857_000361 [Epichloe festucae Fl1]
MTDLCETYNALESYFESRGIRELNPIIKQLLLACPSSCVFAIGGHSVVLDISSNIVAKVSIKAGDPRIRQEQKIFELLQDSKSHNIVQCFYHGVDVSFLEYIPHGTLHDRMSLPKHRPVLHWMLQLTTAVAYLEELGYAHGDLNPQNILLNDDDELILIDFDHSLEIGEDVDVGYEPYVRQSRERDGGLFGVAGPKPEQFALGSIFWYMSRGNELYAELSGPDQVERLIDCEFPDTDPAEPIDRVIKNCWLRRYARIADLLEEIKAMVGDTARQEKQSVLGHDFSENRRICEKYYTSLSVAKAVHERNHGDDA